MESSPREAAVPSLTDVERARDAGGSLSKLHAVAQVTCSAHGVRDPIPELPNANSETLPIGIGRPAREVDQFEQQPAGACAAPPPTAAPLAAPPAPPVAPPAPAGALCRIATQSDFIAGELEEAHVSRTHASIPSRVRRSRASAGRSCSLRRQRLPRRRRGHRGHHALPRRCCCSRTQQRDPLVVAWKSPGSATTGSTAVRRRSAAATCGIADRKTQPGLRLPLRRAHDDLGIAFVLARRKVREPLSVVRERGRANPLPGEQVVQRQLAAGRGCGVHFDTGVLLAALKGSRSVGVLEISVAAAVALGHPRARRPKVAATIGDWNDSGRRICFFL